jgi:hypothetical protein
MPIIIKKPNGVTKELPRVSAAKAPPQSATITDAMTAAEAWLVVKDKTVEMFCAKLAAKQPSEITNRAEVVVAYYLGLGSKEARTRFEHANVMTVEWPRLLPWFAQPFGTGTDLLPDKATWEVARIEVDGGYGGYATLNIPGNEPFQATAKTAWAALAICLMRAQAKGLLVQPKPEQTEDAA